MLQNNPNFQVLVRDLARIPEHSLPLMRAMSGGEPFLVGSWLFFAASDWLMAIAYPLQGSYSHEDFEAALAEATQKTGASSFFAIGPDLPERLKAHIVDTDRYYVLSANAPIPSRLRNPVKKATQLLKITEDRVFTAAHRRLWAEFLEMNKNNMESHVSELYARTPKAMDSGNLRLLNAVDEKDNLVASLLLDYTPANFTSYILGAHSRKHYVPHATDLLFATMLANSRKQNKSFICLGLGVNDGILRFKRKWGAKPQFSYNMAVWEEKGEAQEESNVGHALAVAFLRSGSAERVKIGNDSQSKPFAMLWRVEKNNVISWLGGTAHFFYHNFEYSFRKLFKKVDNVIFEGPLDPEFMAAVDKAGKTLPANFTPLIELMTEEEIYRLEKTVHGPRGKIVRALGMEQRRFIDVRWLLAHAMPWCAFFTLWANFLERHGWHDSVDMEAWRIAREMNKNIIGMENLDEQLESLSSLPVERVLRFFRSCGQWKKYARNNLTAYLAGDLEKMMGSSAEFPTRTEHVVGRRDERFRQRMRPYLEAGRCAVFVGSAHLVNLRHMLVEDGFTVRQEPFGVFPKLHLKWRDIFRPDGKIAW